MDIMQMWQVWVIAALICFIIEIFTTGFAVACFSIGALAAAVAAALGCALIWQVTVFALFTFLAFIFVRPFVLKTFFRPKHVVETNANALIGRKGRVSTDIEPAEGKGRVAIDGDDWKAVSVDGVPIAKGTAVEVVGIDSVVLIVKIS